MGRDSVSPRLPNPLDRLLVLPAEALAVLRILPAMAEHTESMAGHTAVLSEMSATMDRVAKDTEALPTLRKAMVEALEAWRAAWRN